MEHTVSSLRKRFQQDLQEVKGIRDAEDLKVKYLGKKGPLQELMLLLRDVSADERPRLGKEINLLKEELERLCDQAIQSLGDAAQAQQLREERIDVSIPGRRRNLGRKHPISQMMDRVLEIFVSMGFSVQYGPEIDSDYYNFEGLNFPADHPAREMQDTFYINSEMLLRTHTSNTQLRVMESQKPPIRIVAPGTVYRNETISSRSHVFFHQVEGLYIDRQVTFADLFSTIDAFLEKLFEAPVKTRYRPSFFPFVEPGLEADIECLSCRAQGCRLCKQTGWLEILGAGMVHPEVLKNGGIDPEEYSGYAWGLGIERLAMLRWEIKDIRQFTENNLRFLQQF